jgi:hypothetical protein
MEIVEQKLTIMTKELTTLLIVLLNFVAFSQDNQKANSTGEIGINSELSYRMLEPNQDLRKVSLLLHERQEGALNNKRLIIGSSIIPILDYQKSNMESKFSYLMRHPTSNNQIGKEVSEAVLHSIQLSLTTAVNDWLTGYTEILYNPEQSFGPGTITSLNRNQLQLRKGYVLIGDLNKFPVYGALGKMDAPFGQTKSVSPFTNSTMWHAFGGLAYGAQVGFDKQGLNVTFMGVQGGAQFRAMHTTVGDSTNVPSLINNFTADINYTLKISQEIEVLIGGSYMHGSAYYADFPVTHFAAGGENNPAYTYYGELNIKDQTIIQAGFAKTVKVWPGTHNPTPPLNVFAASKVSSFDIGVRYEINPEAEITYAVSGEYSNFIAGPAGAPWHKQDQLVFGLSSTIKNSSRLFVEFFSTEGYVPLNFISGSAPNQPFPAGQTHSLSNSKSFGIVAGCVLTI